MNTYWFDKLKEAAREVIRTEKAMRGNKWSWAACHPPQDTPEGLEYKRVSDEHRAAMAEFWMLTDCEYDTEEPYAACWEWRYSKVMARKCCHLQSKNGLFGSTAAKELMKKLHKAEVHLYEVLGLSEEYKSPCQYIEEAFPNLKLKN